MEKSPPEALLPAEHAGSFTTHHSTHYLPAHAIDSQEIPINSLVEQMGECLTTPSVSKTF